MRLLAMALLVAAIGLGVFASMRLKPHVASLNFRVTLIVDEGGVERTGHGVWNVRLTENRPFDAGTYHMQMRGEAIPIELPGKGLLVAVLRSRLPDGSPGSNDLGTIPETLFADRVKGQLGEDRFDRVKLLAAIASRPGLTQAVPLAESSRVAHVPEPVFLLFADGSRPGTATLVDPVDPAQTLGSQVQFKALQVEITDDPVTVGIGRLLPWISTYKRKDLMLDGHKYNIMKSSGALNMIGPGDFSTEIV